MCVCVECELGLRAIPVLTRDTFWIFFFLVGMRKAEASQPPWAVLPPLLSFCCLGTSASGTEPRSGALYSRRSLRFQNDRDTVLITFDRLTVLTIIVVPHLLGSFTSHLYLLEEQQELEGAQNAFEESKLKGLLPKSLFFEENINSTLEAISSELTDNSNKLGYFIS